MRLTERDLELLAFVAEHRLVLAAHAQALLGVSAAAAYARLKPLTDAGYLSYEAIFHQQPGCYQATRKGLAAVGSRYSPRRVDPACYQHDVGVAWLWLAAREGTFGPLQEVISERRLRSHDGAADREAEPLGVRLGGLGRAGRERLHYPDLMLITRAGGRVAIELELTPKGRLRREKILGGYGADRRIDAVLYVVERAAVGRAIIASAERLGISRLVCVQRVRWGEAIAPGAPRAAERRREPDRHRETTR